ncbi:DMT family transporter [Oceanibium sediminis]|uniref:DMT family transporter n=1 Tax=Oceanibium sediminis TaxID=2026339 RepID=UPI0018E556EE|nr:DMT family transporter [Oceanibium sediminis]
MQRLSVHWRAILALVATILIWASFLVVTRAAVTTRLGVTEVGLIRYGVGALLFLPVALRHGVIPAIPLWQLIALPLFGGVGFLVCLGLGLKIAPVADSGVFTPSMLPLYVAILSSLFLAERFSPGRKIGFVLIVVGALSVGGWSALGTAEPGVWRGHLLFTAASISWAFYTVTFRISGLGAAHASAVLCFWSALAFAGIALVNGVDFSGIPLETLAIQVLFQGVLSGFVATYTFFYAIRHLGPSRTSAFAAMVPVLAALGGWAVLGEPIGWIKAGGILVVSAGVALASGVFLRGERVD